MKPTFRLRLSFRDVGVIFNPTRAKNALLRCAIEKQNPSGRMRGSLLLGLDSKDRVPPSAFSLLLAARADRPAFPDLTIPSGSYRFRANQGPSVDHPLSCMPATASHSPAQGVFSSRLRSSNRFRARGAAAPGRPVLASHRGVGSMPLLRMSGAASGDDMNFTSSCAASRSFETASTPTAKST